MPKANCWCGVPNPRPEDVDPDCPKHGDGEQPYGRRTSRVVSLDEDVRRSGAVHSGRVSVELVGGSPAQTVDGIPRAWYENWLRNV